jgi:hypothetical protein
MLKPSTGFLDSFWSYFHPGYKEKGFKGINSIADLSKVFSSSGHLKGINGKDVLQLKSYFDEELSINEELRKLFNGMTGPDDQGKENKIMTSINDQINRNAILTKKLNVNSAENIWIKQQLKANEKLNKKLLIMLRSRPGSGSPKPKPDQNPKTPNIPSPNATKSHSTKSHPITHPPTPNPVSHPTLRQRIIKSLKLNPKPIQEIKHYLSTHPQPTSNEIKLLWHYLQHPPNTSFSHLIKIQKFLQSDPKIPTNFQKKLEKYL